MNLMERCQKVTDFVLDGVQFRLAVVVDQTTLECVDILFCAGVAQQGDLQAARLVAFQYLAGTVCRFRQI